MFKAIREQGMSISEIVRRTASSRKTVRKYIAMEKPERYSREGKQSVINRKLKASKSTFNGKFMDFAEYYGIVIRLCYPYGPETKGKIENTIKYLRYNFFNGRTFSNLNDINIQCMEC